MSARVAGNSIVLEGYRVSTVTLVCSTLAMGVLSLALPITTLQLYDRILPNQSTSTLAVLVIGVVIVIALEVVLRLTRAYLIGLSGAAFVHRLSCEAMGHVLAADLAWNRQSEGPVDYHSLGAIRNLKDFHNGQALTSLIELVFVPVFLALIAYIGGFLVLVPATLLLIFVIMTLLNGLILKKALGRREGHDDRRFTFLIRSLNAIHSVKACAQEQYLLRRYERLQTQSCVANFGVSDAMTASFNASTLFSHVMTAATVGCGALAVIGGSLTTGSLIAIVLLSGRIMQPVQRGLIVWTRYQDYGIARDKVARIFAAPVVVEDSDAEIPERKGTLDLEAVSFGYGDEGPPVLNGLDLSLRRGEAISITGSQGCGKTTLLKLIAGLHRPTAGRVLVDGLEATRYPPHRLNEHVGFMSSNEVVFRGTIRDNITRFGDVPLAQAMFIAGLLDVDREISKLPAGLDTKLEGTGSDSIPPGIKQRIAIIRILATKPRILLFDNADRALDLEGYGMVHNLLARLTRKTAMIIVSDDENLRRLASRHFELDGGKLHALEDAAGISIGARRYRSVRL